MRARLIKKRKMQIKLTYILGVIFFCILFFTFFFVYQFNKKITPKLLSIAEVSINKLNESILTQYRVKNLYKNVNLEDLILINKNKKDEIIAVDFKLENAYEALSVVTSYLQNHLEDENARKNILKYYSEDLSSNLDSIILTIPIGVASHFIYLANLGPKIPVKVNYMGYLSTSIRIKLEDYGINNVLVSIFIDCSITNEFIVPSIEKEINHDYSILIASKIIQGIVPDYYGGAIEAKSNVLNVPIK